MDPLTIELAPTLILSDRQFADICEHNRDIRFELTATGALIAMPPTGGDTGRRNTSLCGQLWDWNRRKKLGYAFDSSTAFKLPNGAIRSPDASWVARDRWMALTAEERQSFPPLCPDFVVELRSASDSLKPLQDKMQEYGDNGCRLGWLLDIQGQRVEVYRPGQGIDVISFDLETRQNLILSGDTVLPGFRLDLEDLLLV